MRHNNFPFLHLFGLQSFSKSCSLQLPPQGEDRLNWQNETESKLNEAKHVRIQNFSSSLELVLLGITILLPLCRKLSDAVLIFNLNGQCMTMLLASPDYSLLAVLLAMLNSVSKSHRENTTWLLFLLPLPTYSTFTAHVERNQTK